MNAPPIILPREVAYEWSPELVKLGTRRFIFRQTGWQGIVFVGAIAAFALGLAVVGAKYWWPFAIAALIPPFLWLIYYLRIARIRYEMPDRRVVVRVEADSITFQTSEHRSTLKWSGIKKLWTFPDVLLLFTYTKQNYSTVPVAPPLGEELKRFIESKVRESGGEVS